MRRPLPTPYRSVHRPVRQLTDRTWHRPRGDGDQGSGVAETAVLMPLLLLLVMVVFQVGIWMHTRNVAATAANKGLDAARVETGTTAEGRQATEDFLTHAGALQSPAVEVTRTDDTATVSVNGEVTSVMFGLSLPLEVTVDAPVERVIP